MITSVCLWLCRWCFTDLSVIQSLWTPGWGRRCEQDWAHIQFKGPENSTFIWIMSSDCKAKMDVATVKSLLALFRAYLLTQLGCALLTITIEDHLMCVGSLQHRCGPITSFVCDVNATTLVLGFFSDHGVVAGLKKNVGLDFHEVHALKTCWVTSLTGHEVCWCHIFTLPGIAWKLRRVGTESTGNRYYHRTKN